MRIGFTLHDNDFWVSFELLLGNIQTSWLLNQEILETKDKAYFVWLANKMLPVLETLRGDSEGFQLLCEKNVLLGVELDSYLIERNYVCNSEVFVFDSDLYQNTGNGIRNF